MADIESGETDEQKALRDQFRRAFLEDMEWPRSYEPLRERDHADHLASVALSVLISHNPIDSPTPLDSETPPVTDTRREYSGLLRQVDRLLEERVPIIQALIQVRSELEQSDQGQGLSAETTASIAGLVYEALATLPPAIVPF
jgi:hypothetical protein